MASIVGIKFKRASKVYHFDSSGLDLKPGDTVIVEVEKGLGLGNVAFAPKDASEAPPERPLKKVVRKAEALDMEREALNREREAEAMRVCREKIAAQKLPMKLIGVEYAFDASKAVFFFTSEQRVDFRDLVKELASAFYTRIEMRQVGVRDEAKFVGGIGPCSRELCCASFLTDFAPVTVRMAKDQNLALNPAKISGVCGRLMCCLGYEHEPGKGGNRKKGNRGEKKDNSQDGAQAKADCSGCAGGKESGERACGHK